MPLRFVIARKTVLAWNRKLPPSQIRKNQGRRWFALYRHKTQFARDEPTPGIPEKKRYLCKAVLFAVIPRTDFPFCQTAISTHFQEGIFLLLFFGKRVWVRKMKNGFFRVLPSISCWKSIFFSPPPQPCGERRGKGEKLTFDGGGGVLRLKGKNPPAIKARSHFSDISTPLHSLPL